ncbi:MAG: hypothetical protein JNM18_26165 [Planctomycetaceae bacterium]|nr:hypothetical protein [Planctomycetaceae bacterium]
MNIPESVQKFVGDGQRLLFPKWRTLSSKPDFLPEAGGVYAIGCSRAVQYDTGTSRIIYIGSSVNIRGRAPQHRTVNANRFIKRFWEAYGPLAIAFWPADSVDECWLRAIEGEALCAFERKFGRMPLANIDFPSSPDPASLRGRVDWAQCMESRPIGLSEIVTMTEKDIIYLSPKNSILEPTRINDWFYEDKKALLECHLAEQQQQQHEHEICELSYVALTHIASWTIEKLREIITISERLKKETSNSGVVRYQASDKSVPLPHTWGEVAVVRARMDAGMWMPPKRIWVKVLSGKILLGQGICDAFSFYGQDKSDLPQCASRRTEAEYDCEIYDRIESQFFEAFTQRR